MTADLASGIIRDELGAFSPTEVIQDPDVPGSAPTWGDGLMATTPDLSSYFVTSDRQGLVDTLMAAIDAAELLQKPVTLA